jgi:predicted phosphodiesterase
MRIALIADVHGNLWALDAVLADIARRGADATYDLGDVAQGSLRPAEVVCRMREAGIPSIRGNADRLVLDDVPAAGYEADHALARHTMTAGDLAWLAAQPTLRHAEDIVLCHGTPASDTTYLLETVAAGGVRLATDAEIAARLAGVEGATLIAAGHSHVARVVHLADGRICVNPGSVGLAAYDEDSPAPYAMESGSPHARFAIVERRGGGWHVEQIAVPYDWDAAADLARERGRPDRAHWIRTGRGLTKRPLALND